MADNLQAFLAQTSDEPGDTDTGGVDPAAAGDNTPGEGAPAAAAEGAPAADAEGAPAGGEPEEVDDTPPEGLDARGQSIWRQERARRKELQRQVNQMNDRWMELVGRLQQSPPPQQPQPLPAEEIEIPDFEDDPIGHLRVKNEILERQLNEVNQERVVRQQTSQQIAQFQQLQAGIGQMETAFAAKHADYHEAVGFMYQNVAKMATAMGYSPAQVQQTISQMAMDISMRALQAGQNPAEMAYNAARNLGYAGPRPTGSETEERHPAAPKPPTSLSSVAGKRAAPGTMPSWDTVAKMSDEEFDKLWQDMERSSSH
jgi:hypothetical protein